MADIRDVIRVLNEVEKKQRDQRDREVARIMEVMQQGTFIPLLREGAGLSRIWKKVIDEKLPFIIISAFRSTIPFEGAAKERENLRRSALLVREIRKVGLGATRLKGGYMEINTGIYDENGKQKEIEVEENSFFVPWIKERTFIRDEDDFYRWAQKLCRMTFTEGSDKYENPNDEIYAQDSFLYGDSAGNVWKAFRNSAKRIITGKDSTTENRAIIVTSPTEIARYYSQIRGTKFVFEGGYFPRGKTACMWMSPMGLSCGLSEFITLKTSDIAGALSRMDESVRPPQLSKQVIQRAGSLLKIAERRLKYVSDVRALKDERLNQLVSDGSNDERVHIIDNGLFLRA